MLQRFFMRKFILGVIMSLALLPETGLAYQRVLLPKAEVKKMEVTFNSETINAYYLMFDSRIKEEKEADTANGELGGSVIVFFQGHGQRPDDGYNFTELLGIQSKSGIVIVPVCDTPYGKDPLWRGDKGKMVVLTAMVRYLLNECGVSIDGYKPLTDMEIKINGKPVISNPDNIKAKLCTVGWSHGGILAREFAYNYPDAVTGLSTVCAAGYKKWGCTCHLLARFSWEGLHIGTLTFSKYAPEALGAGWGLTCGVTGDAARSIPDSISSCQPSKLGRSCRDINDCTKYLDDTNAAVPDVKNIVVIFGRSDTCMDPKDYGIKDLDNPSAGDVENFWKTYYPANVAGGSNLTFRILPGMHVGPATHSDLYAEAVLDGLDQIDKENASLFPVKKEKDKK
jgi:hypothetical protein